MDVDWAKVAADYGEESRRLSELQIAAVMQSWPAWDEVDDGR